MFFYFVGHRSQYLNEGLVEDRWYNHAEDGTFCITVPLLQIDAIVEKLEKSNRDWDVRAKSDPQASRNLNVCQIVDSLPGMQPYINPS